MPRTRFARLGWLSHDHPATAARMAPGLFEFVWRISVWHQLALACLSTVVFLLTMAPLELQRRIVNDAIGRHDLWNIALLCAGYVGVALLAGAIKLGLNVYRGWVSEMATRELRRTVFDLARECRDRNGADERQAGISLSVILAEVEPVGSFVGISISEPLLQFGILMTVFGYMVAVQPLIALMSFLLFSPQLVFVPLMQHAINRRARTRITTMREIGAELVEDWNHGLTPASRRRYDQHVDEVFTLHIGIFWFKYSMNFLMNLMDHIGVAGVLLVGGWFVLEGRTELGTIVAFLSGLARVTDPWGDFVNYFREMTIARMKYSLIASLFADPTAQGAGEIGEILAEAEPEKALS